MILAITPDAPQPTTSAILAAAAASCLGARTTPDGHGGALVGVDGSLTGDILTLPGVDSVHASHKPYMLASKEHRSPSVIRVGTVRIGGGRPVMMAGPCVVDGRELLLEAAEAVRAAGADMLRGGAFKPRTSP